MKVKNAEDLKDGMWCRLASGEVYTRPGAPAVNRTADAYEQALIDMGAEWYPKIPEGYRLADRAKYGPGDALPFGSGWSTGTDYPVFGGIEFGWRGTGTDLLYRDDYEYIVPVKPKVYTVDAGMVKNIVYVGNDFQPGDRVTVQKVED